MTGWKRALGITLTALVVGFGGLEVNLRLLGAPIEIFNPLNGFHEGDPVLGWRGKQNIARRFHTPEFDVLVRHDEDGFRRPEPPRPPEARRSYLVLGDSLGWGWGVEQGELFSDHLQRALAPDVALYNRSVNAYSTGQEYLLLQQQLADHSYDGVLIIVSRTDLGDNADDKKHRPAFDLIDGDLVPRNQPPPGALKGPIERFIDDHSYAINFISWQLAAMKRWWTDPPKPQPAQAPDVPVAVPGEALAKEEVVANASASEIRSEPGYDVTRRLLLEIAALCRRHDVALYLIYASTYPELRHTPVEVGLRDLVEEIAQLEGNGFLDLNEIVGELQDGGTHALIPRDGHWSALGHRAVADAIGKSGFFDALEKRREKKRTRVRTSRFGPTHSSRWAPLVRVGLPAATAGVSSNEQR